MLGRTRTVVLTVTVLSLVTLVHLPIVAQTSSAQFSISGTSTVRGWTCQAEGTMESTLANSNEPIPGFPSGVETVAIKVMVRAIDCPEEQMTEHLREAMDVEEYPDIVYHLEHYTFKTDDTAEATGTMTIHGVTNPITFNVRVVQSPEGVHGVGETSVNMTEYGVSPPSVWLGMLNVGELVEIQFDALLPTSD